MARRPRSNPLKGSAEHIKRLSERRDSKFMSGLGGIWTHVVLSTAWFGPPAKVSTIIFEKRRAKMEVKIGWFAYRSGVAGSIEDLGWH